jgi:hypothetical protein
LPNSDSEDLKVVKEDISQEIVQMDGTIKSSLYESMLECADSPQLAIQMAEIFAWQIDFLTECREGDTFKILVEKQYKGDFYRWGKILAAQYEGELLSKYDAVLFEAPSGNIDYYTKEGKSLRKAFLRAPLNYKYISSYFSNNRLHRVPRFQLLGMEQLFIRAGMMDMETILKFVILTIMRLDMVIFPVLLVG